MGAGEQLDGRFDLAPGAVATEREAQRAEGDVGGDTHGEERRVGGVLAGVAGGPG